MLVDLTEEDVRLIHELSEYSQTDWFGPEREYTLWRDRVKAQYYELIRKICAST